MIGPVLDPNLAIWQREKMFGKTVGQAHRLPSKPATGAVALQVERRTVRVD